MNFRPFAKLIKAIILFSSFLFITARADSQKYQPADAGSKVHFVIRNFGFKTGGDFTGLKGSIEFNPKTTGNSKFDVTVDATTIDTDNSMRDDHLRKSEYFDVEKYPVIRLASTRVTESTIAGRFYFIGTLTIKGITKAVEFVFCATPLLKGYLFKGEFTINRRDFGVGGSSISMSDNLTISLSVAAIQ